jgi:hypothetical protein
MAKLSDEPNIARLFDLDGRKVDAVLKRARISVDTIAEREAIPITSRTNYLQVYVGDQKRTFVWVNAGSVRPDNGAVMTATNWVGLYTQEESKNLGIGFTGSLPYTNVAGLTEGYIATDAIAAIKIADFRALAQSSDTNPKVELSWGGSGVQPASQLVSWGGFSVPLSGSARSFTPKDWTALKQQFFVGNSLTDPTGRTDGWAQLYSAALGVGAVYTAKWSSDARQVYRTGATPLYLTLQGNLLPAGGTARSITAINGSAPNADATVSPQSWLNEAPGSTGTGNVSQAGTIVDGAVTRHGIAAVPNGGSTAYTFTQDAGGAALALSGPVLFIPDVAQELVRSDLNFWPGNNYFFSGVPNTYGDYTNPQMWVDMAAIIAKAAGNRVLILPVLPSADFVDRGVGTAYNAYLAANARTRALYPTLWALDTAGRDLIQRLQASGDGSANDNADIANGFIPRSLRADALHLNTAGYAIVAAFMIEARARQTLPPSITQATTFTLAAAGINPRTGSAVSDLAVAAVKAATVAASTFGSILAESGVIGSDMGVAASFARASSAYSTAEDGSLYLVGQNQPRFVYDAAKSKRGLKVEAAYAQEVRNVDFANEGTPGVIGSGGVFPAYVTQTNTATGGLVREYLGIQVVGGIRAMAVRISGTAATAAALYFNFDDLSAGTGSMAGVAGDTRMAVGQVGVASGSVADVAKVGFGIIERTKFGNYVIGANDTVSISRTLLGQTGILFPVNAPRKLTGATTVNVAPAIVVEVAAGKTIDFVLLIGMRNCYTGRLPHSLTTTTGAIPAEILGGTIRTSSAPGALVMSGWAPSGDSDTVAAQAFVAAADTSVTLRRQGGKCYGTVRIAGAVVFDQVLGEWIEDTFSAAIVQWDATTIRACLAGGPVKSATVAGLAALAALDSWRGGSDRAGANVWGGSLVRCQVLRVMYDARSESALPTRMIADDFARPDGVIGKTPDGKRTWGGIPQGVSTSAVRTAVIKDGAIVAPSAAFESTSGVTAAYPGLDLGAGKTVRRHMVRLRWRPAIAFTGSITGNVLSVSAVAATPVGKLDVGSVLSNGRTVTALGTGTGGVGTYTVSAGADVASTALTAYKPNLGNATVISQANGLTDVKDVTGTDRATGSLHFTFTDQVVQLYYFLSGGAPATGTQISYSAPCVVDGVTEYTCGYAYLGDGFFEATMPDGGRVQIYSPITAAQMGRYLINEPYFSASAAQAEILAVAIETMDL